MKNESVNAKPCFYESKETLDPLLFTFDLPTLIENMKNSLAWAFTILKNTYIDCYRHKSRKNIHIDQTGNAFSQNMTITSCSDDPDAAYAALEIDRNIERLNDKFRIPFNMYLNGYKYKEIADELNMNIGTVKNRIFLSKKHLMVKLSN